MTRDEALKRLTELRDGTKAWQDTSGRGESMDPEEAHEEADSIILALLGDEEVAHLFHSIYKWYA
jgi:hypothetical protein